MRRAEIAMYLTYLFNKVPSELEKDSARCQRMRADRILCCTEQLAWIWSPWEMDDPSAVVLNATNSPKSIHIALHITASVDDACCGFFHGDRGIGD